MNFSKILCFLAVVSVTVFPFSAFAEFKVLIGIDPADDITKRNLAVALSPTPSLSSAIGSQVLLKQTSDLTDVMRASRTQENDILIGPAHVTASAISHQYQLFARDNRNAQFVLLARKDIERIDQLAGKRLYLTEQDSVRTYLAKGLLNEAGFNMKSLKQTVFGKTSGAGLLALSMNLADVTIAEQTEAQEWMKANPGVAKILKISRPVPSGMAVMVRKNLPETDRKNLLAWLTSPKAEASGFGKMQPTTAGDNEQYRYIASLGILTPENIVGITRVNAAEVAKLLAAGAIAVDTRTVKEYDQAHITGAVSAPYIERSLKDPNYEASLDDFSALDKLPRDKPLIFFCNGPECWKSYKASRTAKSKGIKQVYWYRGGMPEWIEKGMPVSRKTEAALASAGSPK